MPKFDEWAEVVAGGATYNSWNRVAVTRGLSNQGVAVAMLQLVEPTSGTGASFANLKLKPGDKVTVILAGHKVFDGFVTDRQAAYDAQQRGVQIIAKAAMVDITFSDVPLKGSQFKNYPLESIGKRILEPFGLKLKIENGGKDADKKFKDVNVIPGDTAYSFLDRLARTRGLRLRSGEDGNVIAGKAPDSAQSSADLEEGNNILQAIIRITDDAAFSQLGVPGQQRGDDQTDGETARKPAALVEGGGFSRYRHRIVLPDMPGDKDDMRLRADREADNFEGGLIFATVTVQGWLKPSGGIWKEFDFVRLKSPLGPMNHTLGIQEVTFLQDESGTKTILTLVKPGALGSMGGPGPSGGEGGVLPGDGRKPAKADDDA